MSDADRGLNDATDAVAELSVAERAPEVTPENLDMESWLQGVRPTRRSIKLRPNAHLLAEMDRVADEIDRTPDGPEVEALILRFEQLREQYEQGIWFTVEKRSQEWLKAESKRLVKELGLKTKSKDADEKDEAEKVLGMHLAAARIVEPQMTADQLQRLMDANEGESVKLINLVNVVHNQLADHSEVLKRDFSSRRSGSRGTPG